GLEERAPRPGRGDRPADREAAVRPAPAATAEKAQARAQGPDYPVGKPAHSRHHRLKSMAKSSAKRRPTGKKPAVGLIMGSQSDWATMHHAADTLAALG